MRGMLLKIALCILPFISFLDAQNQTLALGDDTYNFCGKDKNRGDHSACHGFCLKEETICSKELGVCSCKTDKLTTGAAVNYDCKSTTPRSRCSNACKSYATLHPKFIRGPTRICTSEIDGKRRCFCMPRKSSSTKTTIKPKMPTKN